MVEVIKAFWALLRAQIKTQKIKTLEKIIQRAGVARLELKAKALAAQAKLEALIAQK